MKYCFLIMFSLICFKSKAQTWCPPGAAWHYTLYSNGYPEYDGVLEMKQTNTLVINTKTCSEISGTYIGKLNFLASPTQTVNNYTTIQTYLENGVLYLYNSSSLSFDTIVNFNSAIGDKWQLIEFEKNQTPCNFSRPIVTVTDTGHVPINGFYLKRIVINYQAYMQNFTDTIIERLGAITQFMFPRYQCIIDGPSFGKFVCYSDNNFPLYVKPGAVSCNYIPTGLNEYFERDTNINIFPNPTKEKLFIEAEEIIKIKVTNYLGQTIFSLDNPSSKQEMDVSSFSSGIYFLIVRSKTQQKTFKIVKE